VNSTAIPVGANNPLIKNLNFTFTQNTWRVAKLIITDAD
jgi:alpha-glucosidase (family GH31 glycosyl hydrolase)